MVAVGVELSEDILVVDDQSANRTAIEAILEGIAGSVVLGKSSGEEALRIMLQRSFAVILMDVRMPGLGGLETARLIRETASGRPHADHLRDRARERRRGSPGRLCAGCGGLSHQAARGRDPAGEGERLH